MADRAAWSGFGGLGRLLAAEVGACEAAGRLVGVPLRSAAAGLEERSELGGELSPAVTLMACSAARRAAVCADSLGDSFSSRGDLTRRVCVRGEAGFGAGEGRSRCGGSSRTGERERERSRDSLGERALCSRSRSSSSDFDS